MRTSLFDYDLPKRFIAQNPVTPRDSSKLLVYDSRRDKVFHKHFFDIVDFFKAGDVLVLNRSKVVPARIFVDGKTKKKEIFLLEKIRVTVTSKISEEYYLAMVRPGRYFKVGRKFSLGKNLSGEVKSIQSDGTRILKFGALGDVDRQLKHVGETPFPPYITATQAKSTQYQTVYAKEDGSIAAPTAGLHFTRRLLEKIRAKMVKVLEIVLHVGRGTFLSVSASNIKDHKMHSEFFSVNERVARSLTQAKKRNQRIIAVGTTTVRVLESTCAEPSCVNGKFRAKTGETDIFIYPGGHKWRAVDALVTNFHLPKSTLIMLVAGFLENKGVKNPVKKILELYELAKQSNYRFYSFGDAMFIY